MGFDSGQAVATRMNESPKLYCQPDGQRMGDMVSAVVAGLSSNGSLLEVPAGIAGWQALSKAWPCR
jgi:hypothetical protein